MHERENALKEWLKDTLDTQHFKLTPLAGDASFRRYFRLNYNELSQVVMDAPPGKEDLKPFIDVARMLEQINVPAPKIIAINQSAGFLILSDLGDKLLLPELNKESVDAYYTEAIQIILKMQQYPLSVAKRPSFDSAFMLKEMNLCREWFFQAYLGLNLTEEEVTVIDGSMQWLAGEIAKQPRVFIHRDYHSRNLMVSSQTHDHALAVIDFQDAMGGPLLYDLVSLLKDCYISWPRDVVLKWVAFFYNHSPHTQIYTLPELIKTFDLCGLQRHLKVLGVFCRLYLRDGKDGYLGDLPLTLKYVVECCESYPELHPLFNVFQNRVQLP